MNLNKLLLGISVIAFVYAVGFSLFVAINPRTINASPEQILDQLRDASGDACITPGNSKNAGEPCNLSCGDNACDGSGPLGCNFCESNLRYAGYYVCSYNPNISRSAYEDNCGGVRYDIGTQDEEPPQKPVAGSSSTGTGGSGGGNSGGSTGGNSGGGTTTAQTTCEPLPRYSVEEVEGVLNCKITTLTSNCQQLVTVHTPTSAQYTNCIHNGVFLGQIQATVGSTNTVVSCGANCSGNTSTTGYTCYSDRWYMNYCSQNPSQCTNGCPKPTNSSNPPLFASASIIFGDQNSTLIVNTKGPAATVFQVKVVSGGLSDRSAPILLETNITKSLAEDQSFALIFTNPSNLISATYSISISARDTVLFTDSSFFLPSTQETTQFNDYHHNSLMPFFAFLHQPSLKTALVAELLYKALFVKTNLV